MHFIFQCLENLGTKDPAVSDRAAQRRCAHHVGGRRVTPPWVRVLWLLRVGEVLCAKAAVINPTT